ncbi:MAG: peptidoglycan editing factor PgeF [Gammaproteobacteria bacterium]|nr:peptidoglycan editing factor PgeF [Gammaproteobacteria bacterium]MDG2338924.1 peptidoglycan editing factor PgeF [Gammaproteobacteria bacterium]
MIEDQLLFADWSAPSTVVAFSTTRQGGISAATYASLNVGAHVGDDPVHVDANRAILQRELPPNLRWQWLDQVHGTDVLEVVETGSALTADGLLTREKNLICCVQTADCLPIFVAAIDGSEIAMTHAGWKGLASGIIENTISAMKSSGKDLVVWLGPAIASCHFEVGAEVRECFLAAEASESTQDELKRCFSPAESHGKYMADLYGIARIKLSRLGISYSNVSGGTHCTYCDEDRFFSYRRDGVTGRMLNAIYIEG